MKICSICKKILSCVIIAAIICGLNIPSSKAEAASQEVNVLNIYPSNDNIKVYGSLKYKITENDEVAIVGIAGEYNEWGQLIITPELERIIIPETIENKPVTIIKSRAFSFINGINEIHIPSSVDMIEGSSVNCCYDLKAYIVADDNSNYCCAPLSLTCNYLP